MHNKKNPYKSVWETQLSRSSWLERSCESSCSTKYLWSYLFFYFPGWEKLDIIPSENILPSLDTMFCPWLGLYLLLFLCECLLIILVACWHLYLSDNPVKHKISPLYDLFNTIYIFIFCLSDLQLRSSDLNFELSGFYSWACHMIACALNWLASAQGASISNLWWEIHSRK